MSAMPGRLDKIGDWEKLGREAHFDAAALAVLCGVSLRHLERYFRRRFQCRPRDWLARLRCRLVRELLDKGFYENAIAEDLCFADGSHLCHQFKRIYGASPRNLP